MPVGGVTEQFVPAGVSAAQRRRPAPAVSAAGSPASPGLVRSRPPHAHTTALHLRRRGDRDKTSVPITSQSHRETLRAQETLTQLSLLFLIYGSIEITDISPTVC